eukprot:GHVR01001783.1.p1 GENE.GHVR01001783.1~~GHVR01001783.1.p1  ORF type:complete len:235 (+),score=25.11 GHVR01001783.1:58-762(+)
MKSLLFSLSGALYAGASYTEFSKIDEVNFTVKSGDVLYNGVQKPTDDSSSDEFTPEFNVFCTRKAVSEYTMCPRKLPCSSISADLDNNSNCYLTEALSDVNTFLSLASFNSNQKILFMYRLLNDIILALYELPRYIITSRGVDVNDNNYRQGIAYCDLNPSNILVTPNVDLLNFQIKLTGYLGKHKNIINGTYEPSLDSCKSDQGDPKYFSLIKATRYAEEMVLKYGKVDHKRK